MRAVEGREGGGGARGREGGREGGRGGTYLADVGEYDETALGKNCLKRASREGEVRRGSMFS